MAVSKISESPKTSYGGQGASVNISDYTDRNNPYICPTDGYIVIYAPPDYGGNYGNIIVDIDKWGHAEVVVNADSSKSNTTSLFVKKGTPVHVTINNYPTGAVNFRGIL